MGFTINLWLLKLIISNILAPKRQREGWNKTEPKQTYACEDVGCIREVDSKAKRRIKFSVKVAVSVGYPYGWEQTNVQKQH